MKGLLVKDFQILRNQSRIVLILAIMSVFLGFSSEESTFIISYCTFCLSALVTTTVSYDDLDNGYSFLFTLPITRKMYVLEKYLLACIICSVAACFSAVLSIAIAALKGQAFSVTDNLLMAVIVALLCLTMVSVMLPLQMKFGAEKSRVIIFGLVGGVLVVGCALGFLFERLLGSAMINGEVLIGFLDRQGAGMLTAILLLVALVIIGITMGISIRVMEKKEL